MVSRYVPLLVFTVIRFDRAFGAKDSEVTIALLRAEIALLKRQCGVVEPVLAHKSTSLSSDRVVLSNRSRLLNSERSEGSSEVTPEGGTEHGSRKHNVSGHAEEAHHHHEHTEEKEQVVCFGEHAEECSDKEKAQEIEKMVPVILLALFVMGNIVSMPTLILVTKWKDAGVRQSMYRMISTFLSIFCAIFINKLMYGCLIYQVTPCRPPFEIHKGGFGIISHHAKTPEHDCGEAPHIWAVGIFSFLFIFYHIMCTYIMFQARPSSEHWLLGNSRTVFYIAGVLGGHLRGFAGIAIFGLLQEHYFDHELWQVLSCVVAAWLFFAVVCLATTPIRQTYVRKDFFGPSSKENAVRPEESGLVANQPRVSLEEASDSFSSASSEPTHMLCCNDEDISDDEESPAPLCCSTNLPNPPWSKTVIESEDESLAVCIGFLVMQVVCFVTFGHVPAVEEEDDVVFTKVDRAQMRVFESIFVLGIISVLCIRKCCCKGEGNKRDRLRPRITKSLQCCLAMSLCWTLFKHGNYFFRETVNGIFNPHLEDGRLSAKPPEWIIIMATIVNACWFTVSCFILLLYLDFFADVEEKVAEDLRQGAAFSPKILWKAVKTSWSKITASVDLGVFAALCFCCCARPPSKLMTISEIIHERELSEFEEEEGKKKKGEEGEGGKGIFPELIEALGFMIGICWEKSFSEAIEVFTSRFLFLSALVDKDRFSEIHMIIGLAAALTERHPLVFKYFVAVLILIVVMVTWVKYIVPYARIGKSMHNYLQLAEDFGCNLMTNRHPRAVANNLLCQFATTEDYKDMLTCNACKFDRQGRPAIYQFEKDAEEFGQMKCSVGSRCPGTPFSMDELIEKYEDDLVSES